MPPEDPTQIRMVHRPRRGLIVGGAITFGISWGIAAFASYFALYVGNTESNPCVYTCHDTGVVLWIPIAGPIVAEARDPGSGGRAFAIGWSVVQLAGATMLALGIVGHEVPARRRVAQDRPTFHLAPLLARDASGITLAARW
jgi:hypothetical protein